jgi:hypothetical protein
MEQKYKITCFFLLLVTSVTGMSKLSDFSECRLLPHALGINGMLQGIKCRVTVYKTYKLLHPKGSVWVKVIF